MAAASSATVRYVAGTRERLCARCGTWKPHDRDHFYSHAKARFGLHSTCRECHRAAVRITSAARNARRDAYYKQMREYAKAAQEGRL